MTKVEEIKQEAIDYGFEADFVNSIKVEFTEDGYGYDSKLGKYLPIQKKIILFDDRIECIFPTYLHELTHALQNLEFEKRYGVICGKYLYWLALTCLRPLVENHAREIEDRIYAHNEHIAKQPRI
jgi:hypothetical protein